MPESPHATDVNAPGPAAGLASTIYTDRAGQYGDVADHTQQLPCIHLRGVRIHALTERQAIEHVIHELEYGRGGWVVTPNVDHLFRMGRDPILREAYEKATLVVADGMPLIWASRIQGTPLPQRVAGSNLISTLSQAASLRGRSIYLLGGAPGTAPLAAQVLQQRYPSLRVAGTYYPEMGFQNDPEQMRRLSDHILQADPDIVYVALGSPKQEWLINELRGSLPRAWWLGIGISFSFLCGQVQRAPQWMQKVGLEWLHRLGQEPRRLAKRYLLQGLPFAATLLAGALAERFRSTGRPGHSPGSGLHVAPENGSSHHRRFGGSLK